MEYNLYFNHIGTAYIRLEDYDKALEYLFKSLDLSFKNNNKKHQAAIQLNIGDEYKSKVIWKKVYNT